MHVDVENYGLPSVAQQYAVSEQCRIRMQRPLKTVKDPGAAGSAAEKFSACLVWTPIPLITWLLPFVGHMVRSLPGSPVQYRRIKASLLSSGTSLAEQGLCSSRGTIIDFAGPYTVSTGNFAFGDPTRC